MTIATKAMLDDADDRHRGQGINLRLYTAHKTAHDLMRWDETFKDVDYTQLVQAIMEWQE
jgi:hypothetical protein